jgi:hypothetical protein
MPHPLRQHIQRHVFVDGVHAVAVAESLGAFMRPLLDLRRVHHFEHPPPCGGTAPRPEWRCLLLLILPFPQTMHHRQEVKRGLGHGHSPEDAAFPFLERLERHSLAGKVDPLRRYGQGFGHAAPRVMQHRGKGADFARELPGNSQKGGAFLSGEIEAMAVRIMQADQGGVRL